MKFTASLLIISLVLWTGTLGIFSLPGYAASNNNNDNKNWVETQQTQQNSQGDARDQSDSGSNQAAMMGMAAVAAGAAMMAAGAAMMANPPTAPQGAALMAAGAALMAMGMAALGTSGDMKDYSGDRANDYNKLADLNTSNPSTSGTGSSGDGNKIKIDSSLLRDGKVGEIFTDLESKTGLSADDLMDGLNDGKSLGEILANAPKNTGLTADQIDSAIANADSLSAQDAMDKMGITAEDILNASKTGDDANTYNQAGGGGRSTASNNAAGANAANLDALFGANKNGPDGASVFGSDLKLSPEVQSALDKEGITGKSIFEMVSSQYKKKTPMMFGVQKKAATTTTENPFANLTAGDLELN